MGDGMNPWMAQAGQWPYMQAPGGMERPAQVRLSEQGRLSIVSGEQSAVQERRCLVLWDEVSARLFAALTRRHQTPATLVVQAYEGAYGAAAVPEASPQPAASQESARESAPASAADSGCTASFGGDCTLPAKKRGRNAAATSRHAPALAYPAGPVKCRGRAVY